MQWMKDIELPPWAYLLGSLLLPSGCLINVFIKNRLAGVAGVFSMCFGVWLIRWWYEAPADHPRFQKISERRFRFGRGLALTCSWLMLILTVATVCLYVSDVLS